LKGEDAYDEGNEEGSQFESDAASADASLVKEPVPVAYNGRIPIEAFDVIVVTVLERVRANLKRYRAAVLKAALLGQIVAEVERLLSVADDAEARVAAGLKRAARLRQSILKRAFAGDLVP
ncbi:MAG: hypothetical protein LC769_13190, partial [Chloroflexi bacterium]|nr:hypothetical protein [Chloroflexota bacterium]